MLVADFESESVTEFDVRDLGDIKVQVVVDEARFDIIKVEGTLVASEHELDAIWVPVVLVKVGD